MDLTIKLLERITQILMILTLFFGWRRRKNKSIYPIQLYIVSLFAISFIDIFHNSFNDSQFKQIESVSMNVFSILEISLIYYFLYHRISGTKSRFIIKILWLIYLLLCGIIWISEKNFIFSFTPDLFGFESILILIPCLINIFEILKSDFKTDLKKDPNFIATCGVLFYFSVSIPTYFSWYPLYYQFREFENILLLSNVVYSIILIMTFMKSYLCLIPDQQQ